MRNLKKRLLGKARENIEYFDVYRRSETLDEAGETTTEYTVVGTAALYIYQHRERTVQTERGEKLTSGIEAKFIPADSTVQLHPDDRIKHLDADWECIGVPSTTSDDEIALEDASFVRVDY